MEQINERYIKLSSKISYPTDIALGEDITVTIGSQTFYGNCVKHETLDNQDGSVNKVFILKSLSE